MKSPTISVIVPVYNAESTLQRCVDSILAQTFEDFELILINDGSKDLSGDICDEYAAKDSRVKVIHKPNGGPNSARNKGIEKASGDFLIFSDADDEFYDDETFSTNIQYLIDDPSIDIVSFPQYTENAQHKLISKEVQFQPQIISDKRYAFINWHTGKIIDGGYYAKIYRKSIFDGWKLTEEIRFAEDVYHIPDILNRSSNIKISNNGGYIYRFIPNSLIHSEFTTRKRYDLFKVRARLYSYALTFTNVCSERKVLYNSLLEEGYYLFNTELRADSISLLNNLKPTFCGNCQTSLFQKSLLILTRAIGIERGFKLINLLSKIKHKNG